MGTFGGDANANSAEMLRCSAATCMHAQCVMIDGFANQRSERLKCLLLQTVYSYLGLT
jgi:hypothetical protein